MKYCLTLLFTLASLLSFSQNDEIKGHVKSVREKVIFKMYEEKVEEFVNDEGNIIRRNYTPNKGFSQSYYRESSLIRTPEHTLKNFQKTWYFTHYSSYTNYSKSYSKTGKTILEKWYNDDNEIIDTIEYKYDTNDSLLLKKVNGWNTRTEEIIYNKSGIESITYRNEDKYETNLWLEKKAYNEQNKEVRRDFFRDTLYNSSTLFKYNDKGNIIEASEFQPLEDVYSKNLKTEADFLNIKGYTIIYLNNIYNDNRIIQSNKYKTVDRKAILNSSTYYNYEGDKFIITTKKFNKDNISIREFEYKNNLLINERFFYRGNPNELKSFFYDNDNYLVKAIIKDREGTFNIEFKYKFDRKGNWIKQTKYVNGVPMYELIREIEYY